MSRKLGRQQLIELVRKLLEPPADADAEDIHGWLDTVERNVPDPLVADYVYWPEREMSAEEIVDKALAFKPTRISGEELISALEEYSRLLARPAWQHDAGREKELFSLLASNLPPTLNANLLVVWAEQSSTGVREALEAHHAGRLQRDPLWRQLSGDDA